jgi:glycine/D-amino acid oxidase-like deaminating enzyme
MNGDTVHGDPVPDDTVTADTATGPLERRRADLERLTTESFDLVIVGGGIVGAGALLDAATRGLRVALVEQEDIASGTSSRSSRLIHGGLRYLEQFHLPLVREALATITAKAGGGFMKMDRDEREALFNGYYASGAAAAAVLGRVILGAYYRDDRVLQSLGLEARAPFPKGYALEQGDWSLLDAVRERPPLWRDDRKELAE